MEAFPGRGCSLGKGMRAWHVWGAHMVPGAAETWVSIVRGDVALISCPRSPFVLFLYLTPQFLPEPSCHMSQPCSFYLATGGALKLLAKATTVETPMGPAPPLPRGILTHLLLLPFPCHGQLPGSPLGLIQLRG